MYFLECVIPIKYIEFDVTDHPNLYISRKEKGNVSISLHFHFL